MASRFRIAAATVLVAGMAFAPALQAREWHRGGGWHGGGYHRGGNVAGAAIVGGLIGLGVGAAIANSAPPPAYYYGSPYYAPPPAVYYGY